MQIINLICEGTGGYNKYMHAYKAIEVTLFLWFFSFTENKTVTSHLHVKSSSSSFNKTIVLWPKPWQNKSENMSMLWLSSRSRITITEIKRLTASESWWNHVSWEKKSISRFKPLKIWKITAHSLTVYLSCKLYWSNYLKLPFELLPCCCLCRSNPEVSTWRVNARSKIR